MNYCIDQNSDEPIMFINSFIGVDEDDCQGIDGAEFQKELLYLDSLGKKRIQIWINSVGGSVVDGFNIISTILKTKTPVDTYNVGLCASIAGVMFMCGRNRVAMDYSLFMAHPPQGGDKEVLDLMQNSLSTILSAKCNLTQDEFSQLMTDTTWLDASQMLDKGLATEIELTETKNKKRMQQATDKHLEALQITNKLLTKKNKKKMLKVTNKLGLSDDANEISILNAITEIENKAAATKAEMQKQIDDAENALNALKEKYNALEVEIEAEKEATNLLNCKNMIAEFAKVGRIANDEPTIEKWVNLAKNDFNGTKELIEGLPLNAIANKIEVVDAEVVEPNIQNFLADAMKKINNKK